MSSSRNHQGALGSGQIEEQLQEQADAAQAIQGGSEVDREIMEAANRDPHTSLDELVESE
ncbi:hypothetical protein [Cohnella sp. AR92]|uniref:hypothetical protein n=1 Tax=Cohnella sp. AR92 TaxID=648716 RepID=UPI000F8F62C0|nr:hypothetical protein [Cohnella sp. AR92]RUS46642.1 hypothetical protein ELR57_13140 [Cohnella sp. AR92]